MPLTARGKGPAAYVAVISGQALATFALRD